MKTLEFKSRANNLLEVTVALFFTSLIITNFINHINNNAVQAKSNYMQWREEKYLEIKKTGLYQLDESQHFLY